VEAEVEEPAVALLVLPGLVDRSSCRCRRNSLVQLSTSRAVQLQTWIPLITSQVSKTLNSPRKTKVVSSIRPAVPLPELPHNFILVAVTHIFDSFVLPLLCALSKSQRRSRQQGILS
jgi:hypothetical protein